MRFEVQGFKFEVCGLRFRVQGLGFGGWGLGCRVERFGVWGGDGSGFASRVGRASRDIDGNAPRTLCVEKGEEGLIQEKVERAAGRRFFFTRSTRAPRSQENAPPMTPP